VWWTNVVEEPVAFVLHCSTQTVTPIYQNAHHHITKACYFSCNTIYYCALTLSQFNTQYGPKVLGLIFF